jgi:hypothetical protein
MGQNGYTIPVMRGRIHDELDKTGDRFGKAEIPTSWGR